MTRKALYYTGLGLVVAGIATFLIGFVSVAVPFGRPMDMLPRAEHIFHPALRAS